MKLITKDSEQKFLELISSLKSAPEGFYALYYNLSHLNDNFKSDYQVKIAVNILADLFRSEDSVIFTLEDKDIVVVYHGDNRPIIEKAIFQIRYLFMDDELAYNDEGFENEDFCSVYDLEFQWRDMFVVARKKANGEDVFGTKSSNHEEEKNPLHVFDPISLDKITKRLQSIDVSEAFRSQPICAYVGGKFKTLFSENYINIGKLKEMLPINVDLSSSRSLFKYMTRILDRRVLHTLTKYPRNYSASPISINLNVRNLMSEDFAAFDKSLSQKDKNSIILEIHIADVFEDINRFLVARDMVQERGYRICLDGLDAISFTQVDRKSLGFDLAKVAWHPEIIENSKRSEEIKAQLIESVKKCGANRIILCRCGEEEAIEFGQSIGISLYQGRYVDKALNPNATVVN